MRQKRQEKSFTNELLRHSWRKYLIYVFWFYQNFSRNRIQLRFQHEAHSNSFHSRFVFGTPFPAKWDGFWQYYRGYFEKVEKNVRPGGVQKCIKQSYAIFEICRVFCVNCRKIKIQSNKFRICKTCWFFGEGKVHY